MDKVLLLTLSIYLFLELLCHAYAHFISKIIQPKLNNHHPEYKAFLKQFFYRLMQFLSILLMSHIYNQMVFSEQSALSRLIIISAFILALLFLFFYLNALIIYLVLRKQSNQASFSKSYQLKVSYILLHPKAFKDVLTDRDYLHQSKYLNYLLNLIAFVLLYNDLKLLLN